MGCHRERGIRFDLPLCQTHISEVLDAYEQERRIAEQRVAARKQAKIDAEAQAVEDVEAGYMLEPGAPIPGWVYYVKLDGVIKIGFTKNLHRRIKEYGPTAQLLAHEPGTRKVERQRHQHFGKYLIMGREWFEEGDDLADWINDLTDAYGHPDPSIGRFTTPTDTAPQTMARKPIKRRY